MSYPSNPPEGPYGPGQPGSGGYPGGGYPNEGYQSGGYPSGGYPGQPDPQQGGYPSGGYPGQAGGYPGQQPGYQDPSGGYPHYQEQPGPYPGYQDQTGGYQAPGDYQQSGYGMPPQDPYGSGMPGQPSADERQMALFAHVGGGLLSWIVPLIIYFIKKDESPFVRDQAAQALNFQLLILIGYVVSSILMVVFIGFLTWFICWVAAIILGVLGGMAANRGEWYRYPFNVKWIK